MSIDVLPCLGIYERELVWHSPQNRSILEVKLVNVEGPPTAKQAPYTV